jgi:hypothetical protein
MAPFPKLEPIAYAGRDQDASVRKTILVFFTWLLPRIPTVCFYSAAGSVRLPISSHTGRSDSSLSVTYFIYVVGSNTYLPRDSH